MEKDFMPSQLPSVTLCLRNTLAAGCFQHKWQKRLLYLWLVTDFLGHINF